jgi:hypothetical protein
LLWIVTDDPTVNFGSVIFFEALRHALFIVVCIRRGTTAGLWRLFDAVPTAWVRFRNVRRIRRLPEAPPSGRKCPCCTREIGPDSLELPCGHHCHADCLGARAVAWETKCPICGQGLQPQTADEPVRGPTPRKRKARCQALTKRLWFYSRPKWSRLCETLDDFAVKVIPQDSPELICAKTEEIARQTFNGVDRPEAEKILADRNCCDDDKFITTAREMTRARENVFSRVCGPDEDGTRSSGH